MENDRVLLIIDDEVDVCILLRKALQKHFYQVALAHSLAEGTQMAETIRPDIILLDNNLPDGYGLEHIGHFKRIDDKEVNIVMISAMDIQHEALAAGADAFIGKPVSIQALDIIR